MVDFKQDQGDDAYKLTRKRMVEQQLKPRGINDPLVLAAMETVPRHQFVPERWQGMAYADSPLPIEQGQTISQPFIVALMIQAVQANADDCTLEIGTGSGYAAAVLAQIVDRVYTIECNVELAEQARQRFKKLGYQNIEVKIGNGANGWPEQAPFPGIIVSAAPEDVPPELIKQLKTGGRLVIPLGKENATQRLMLIGKIGKEKHIREDLGAVRFVPLKAKQTLP